MEDKRLIFKIEQYFHLCANGNPFYMDLMMMEKAWDAIASADAVDITLSFVNVSPFTSVK